MLELIYSIASHQVIAQSSNYEKIYYYQKLADSCHRKALFIFDKAATDISIGTLETVTLAALHSLLSPQTGNIGQLIGLAARLAIDLGAVDRPHINSNEENKIEQIYKSVYCLENQYATALDRPGLLPPPVIDPESRISQDILCLIYQIQSRFRSHRGNVDSTPLLQELDGYFSTIEQMSIRSRGSILATVYETRLLIQPDDEESAVCLLDIYSQRFYIRTALSPSWAYRAGLVVISRAAHLHPDAIQNCGGGLRKRYQAYGNCLLFLEQCSRRWPSANALRMSLQEVFSRASGVQ
ncbi:hypothetical protein N7533_003460 [Penicillium manginii]|uniref:uncharacterized protein n=1 Tax=Penicillium manginii TaxID=203109 RepID=UPI002548D43B|nr:uncharacterized protein N7533_003460 [Penicillium manginii]KAJ5761421.1 hypothetical protein N7533_003460 [Penicillium manginii]